MIRHTILFLAFLLFPPLINAQEPIAQEFSASVICHLGVYQMTDGSQLVIQPSDADNLRYRYFNGVSGKLFPVAQGQYESGSDWSSRSPVTSRVAFGSCNENTIEFNCIDGRKLKGKKIVLPTTPILFSRGNINFYGELVMPIKKRPQAVAVLQYGSGRESAVLNNFVQYLLPLHDIAAFVFDKRGTGRSTGEYIPVVFEI